MNIIANILGLGNAATPLGLEAMKRLQNINPTPEKATNEMVRFVGKPPIIKDYYITHSLQIQPKLHTYAKKPTA